LTKLSPNICVYAPPLKVVEEPIEQLPLKEIFDAAVKPRVPEEAELVKLPETVKVVPGSVFVAAPEELLKIRFP
jgi:ethanolamine utilization cobalamin adenosyltransferase